MSAKDKIAFQGEPGANSHEACRDYFPDLEPAPYPTFEDAFEAVKSGDCQLGMIPVENSIAGRVADVHHLLPKSGLKIIGERFKPIRFFLMANRGVKLEQVRTAVSMPIALAQCRASLRRLGLKTASAGVPIRTFFTGSSIFLPDSVLGTARTWKIALGTCRAESAWRIAALMRAASASSSDRPSRRTTKSGIQLSLPRYSRSTTRLSITSGSASTARYSSAVPMRMPCRLMVASLRP